MRSRDMKLNRYYLFEDEFNRTLFVPVKSPTSEESQVKTSYGVPLKILFLCRVLASVEGGYKTDTAWEMFQEDVCFVRPVPVNELPLYLDIPHKTIHFENAIKAAAKETHHGHRPRRYPQ